VRLSYDGKDGRLRTTEIAFTPAPARLARARAVYDVTLAPDERREIAITLAPAQEGAPAPDDDADPATPPEVLRHWHERSVEIWLGASTTVQTSNRTLDRVLRQALLDLRTLRSRLGECDYYAAGVPWFVTLFGRDASIVGLQTLPYGWETVRHTLRLLARLQARERDPYRDAEPGKILHEYRSGELARLDAIPQSPAYYGTVDATMLFLILVTEYVRWSGDIDLARELRPNIDAALDWVGGLADSDGDGYLDYQGKYGTGLVNQGWKDSGNAIVNEDGSFPEPPIALCEVQAYAYRAWRQVAWLLRALGASGADALEHRAEEMRVRFERDFWDERLGCYVLALQAGGRPARVVSSNAGHVLWGGIASPARAAVVVERLMAPDMFSGWGIRTLSSRAAAYNPMSYHLGSVWPHDNALAVSGFRRYGHDAQAVRVFDAVLDAAVNLRGHRLPELFCGHDRSVSEERPISYPVACSPQAWAAGALPHALWNLLGLRPDALAARLTVQRPRLPRGVDWLEMHGLAIGRARVDLRFERDADDHVRLDAKVGAGDLEVQCVDEMREEMA
jgi:glycogen debranching enzyme